jgi:hypothetical protein
MTVLYKCYFLIEAVGEYCYITLQRFLHYMARAEYLISFLIAST